MKIQKALIFHSKLGPNPPADELDVLDEAAFFEEGLKELEVEVLKLPFDNNLDKNIEKIKDYRPNIIVNLVETIYGDGKLIHIAPALFEHLSVPFTGCSSEAIYVTSNKLLSKGIMQSKEILTPAFFDGSGDFPKEFAGRKFLMKSIWEHASFGMDEHNPVFIDSSEIIFERLKSKNKKHLAFFAEEYIEGREFNVSVIGNGGQPVVLPIAEIKFIDFPVEKPKIVGYRAKWDEDSFEFKNTVRHFVDEKKEETLSNQIKQICLKCWEVFDLRGYARVDFRMDENGRLYVLEINANPCISADSGFVAAANKMGLRTKEIVNFIIKDSNLIYDSDN
jgi:D-alanine-D-alanine ligase